MSSPSIDLPSAIVYTPVATGDGQGRTVRLVVCDDGLETALTQTKRGDIGLTFDGANLPVAFPEGRF